MLDEIPVEKSVNHQGLHLSYFVSHDPATAGVPLAIVPGGLGAAEDYLPDMPQFVPRTCLAMSLRGQGRSDAPPAGYGLADFASDLQAILADSGMKRPCLLAYSMAVPVALTFAAREPGALAGLVIGDYPARAVKLPPEWVDGAVFALGRLSDRPVMEAIQRESEAIELWPLLPAITCPVLVLRGAQEGSKLTTTEAARYQELLPRARVVTFPHSDHALWDPDPHQFFTAIKVFLAELDTQQSAT